MLMYNGKVKFYEELEDKEKTEFFFVAADTYSAAVDRIAHYYSEDMIQSISLSTLSPEAVVIFGEEKEDLFKRVEDEAIKNAPW